VLTTHYTNYLLPPSATSEAEQKTPANRCKKDKDAGNRPQKMGKRCGKHRRTFARKVGAGWKAPLSRNVQILVAKSIRALWIDCPQGPDVWCEW